MIPRFIHSGMVGAPAMQYAAGAALAVLDAALVTGFNVRAPASVTVTAGVATVTYGAAHGYEDQCWLRLAGASAAALNADHRCTVSALTTLTVPAPGVPDGAVTGTMETRVAPLGWERPFTDTNVAVYRSAAPQSARHYYRFRDDNPSGAYCVFRGYESMSSAQAGVDPFPRLGQVGETASNISLYKADATPWVVIGDDRTVYVMTAKSSGAVGVGAFGDFLSYKAADPYNGFVSTGYDGYHASLSHVSLNSCQYLCRDAAGLVKSSFAGRLGPGGARSGSTDRAYPNTVTGGVEFSRPIHQMDTGGFTNVAVRGELRGVLFVYEAIPSYPWLVLPSVAGIDGRVVVLPDSGNTGRVAFAVDEAW